jgi:hypothetical protein
MAKRGRKERLTDEIREKIATNLASCCHRGIAAASAGIGRRTFVTWMQKGKDQPRSRYGAFRRAILEAEKRAEMRLAAIVASAAATDARHAEWMLTHRFPNRWADRTNHEISGSRGGGLIILPAEAPEPKSES